MDKEDKKLTIKERVNLWFEEHGDLINKSAWDRKIEAPYGTTHKHMIYGKKMNHERIKKSHKLIKSLTKINGNLYR